MATKKTDEKPSVVDEVIDDAAPPEYPPGAPALKPYIQLYPRTRRAEFKRKIGDFRKWQEKLSAAQDAGLLRNDDDEAEFTSEQQQARIEVAADADEMFAVMDELMAFCADDPVAYRAWSEQASDNELSDVFRVFMARSQPGEASSSTS